MPKLSIILPVYNTDKYVGAAIESILSQSFKDFELLIIDDCSTDDTWEVVQKYRKDDRVLLSRNTHNSGKNETVNAAFKSCKGEFVTIHDADDISHPMRLEEQMRFLNENEEFVLCGCAHYLIDENDAFISKVAVYDSYEKISRRIKYESCFHGPTVIFRRDVPEKVGGLYRTMKMGEDVDFVKRVTEKFRTCNVNKLLYAYRVLNSSVTKTLNYDLLGRQIDHELIYFYADQRRRSSSRTDSLMRGELEVVDRKIEDIKRRFYKNQVLHLRRRLGYLLLIGICFSVISHLSANPS